VEQRDPTRIPAEVNGEAEVAFTLPNSEFHRHFLERFLEACGKILCLPWWSIHLILYLMTGAAILTLLSVRQLYPGAGYVSFGAEQLAEFTFTMFMLWYLREARSVAILVAARIANSEDRRIWLRAFFAPLAWGWVVRCRNRRFTVRVWLATAVVLAGYWGGQYLFYGAKVFPHPSTYWDSSYPYPQILYVYPTLAKAEVMVAAVAHFWWLSGLMSIAKGRYSSTLSATQRRSLCSDCTRIAIWFTVAVSGAAGFWVLARGLAYGFSSWAYLYSSCLLLLLAEQTVIFIDLQPRKWFRKLFVN